jgi:hypothetical protein
LDGHQRESRVGERERVGTAHLPSDADPLLVGSGTCHVDHGRADVEPGDMAVRTELLGDEPGHNSRGTGKVKDPLTRLWLGERQQLASPGAKHGGEEVILIGLRWVGRSRWAGLVHG